MPEDHLTAGNGRPVERRLTTATRRRRWQWVRTRPTCAAIAAAGGPLTPIPIATSSTPSVTPWQ